MAGQDGRKISSPPGFDPGPSSSWSVTVPTELPGQHFIYFIHIIRQYVILLLTEEFSDDPGSGLCWVKSTVLYL